MAKTNDSAGGGAVLAVIHLSKNIIFLSVAVLVLFLTVTRGFAFGKSLFYVDPAEEAPGTDVWITIDQGETYESLGTKLYEKGIVTDALSFKVQGTLYQTTLYPGEYMVNTSQTIREMLISIDDAAEVLESEEASGTSGEDTAEVSGGYEGDALEGEEAEIEASDE